MKAEFDLPDPITHHAAWCGGELMQRADWLHNLSRDEVKAVRELVVGGDAGLLFPSPNVSKGAGELVDRLRRIQHDLEHGGGACLVKGLPIDGLDERQAKELFAALCSEVGTAVSQSASGELVFSVRDEGHKAGDAKARGPNTRKRLSFHTDRCDVIAFLCLRQAKSGGENQVVSSITLFNELRRTRPDVLRALMQPFTYARHNVDTGNDQAWCRQPIFSVHQGYFACSFLRVLIDRAHQMPELPNLTDEQAAAMDVLEELAADPSLHVTFRQEPGDVLFLNNWVTLHRRNEFVDHDEPELRRHLLRIWLAVPNSRPLHPDFAANYGNTAAGAIRGGMRPME